MKAIVCLIVMYDSVIMGFKPTAQRLQAIVNLTDFLIILLGTIDCTSPINEISISF